MYLFNALDKGNLGNAKTDGMDKDLGFKGNQYNTMLSVSNMMPTPRLSLNSPRPIRPIAYKDRAPIDGLR